MNKGTSEKNNGVNNNNNAVVTDKKRRVWIALATALSMAALLIFSAVLSPSSSLLPHRAFGATAVAKNLDNNNNVEDNNHVDASKSNSGRNISAKQEQYWQDFLALEKESWHYDYNNAEKQNVKEYQKWYCTDLRLHGYEDFTHACDSSAYPKDAMWQQEQIRDEVLWNKANHQPHHETKMTDAQMKYLQKRTEMRDSMTLHGKADDKTWRHYLSLEKESWHYDYSKTEQQNLKAFYKWWNRGATGGEKDEPDKMWFSEQYGHEVLWDKAAATISGSGKTGNDGDDNNTGNLSKGRMQSWFGEAYRQHKAEIEKNGCMDPWERTPSNAAPSWSACLNANALSSSSSMHHKERSM